MKVQINNYYSPSFQSSRTKFDAQAHVGRMYDNLLHQETNYNIDHLLNVLSDNNVKKVLVSDLSGLNASDSDKFVSEMHSSEYMDKIDGNGKVKVYPLISCQPGITESPEIIERLIINSNYVGMKFHPTNTNQPIAQNFEKYSKYMELAEKKGLACVFHSVTDGKSDPDNIIKLAEAHPKLPVVLYHVDLSASPERMSKTIDNIAESINQGKSNLYVDISWLTGFNNKDGDKKVIIELLDKLGPKRILFGSDAPISDMGDSAKYGKFADFVEDTVKGYYNGKTKNEIDKILDRIFYDNTQDIFVDKLWFKNLQKLAGSQGKTFFERHRKSCLAGIAGAIGFVALLGKAIYDERKFNHSKKVHQSKFVVDSNN